MRKREIHGRNMHKI